jgi:hypothetical protein
MVYKQSVTTRLQSTLTVLCDLCIRSIDMFAARRRSIVATAVQGPASSALCSSYRSRRLQLAGSPPCHDDCLRSARVASTSGASSARRTGSACCTSSARRTGSTRCTSRARRTTRTARASSATGTRSARSATRARATCCTSSACGTSATGGAARVVVVRAVVTARCSRGETQNTDQYQTPMIKTDTCHSGVIYTDRSQCKIFLFG